MAAGNASDACTALRAKLGLTAFAQAYATFGACVSAYTRLEQQNVAAGDAACRAEQSDPNFASAHGGKTFEQLYGSGKTGKNAFGKCVSVKAKASSRAEQQGRLNPARTCRAARLQMGATAFSLLYGTNANDRNAFGKCVSRTARAQLASEVSSASTCRAEQADANFASAHGGKTFDQSYGTNADLSNAFGKCVSGKATAASNAEQQATVTAAKACLVEYNADVSAFRAKYSTFGRCVSQKASTK